MVSQCSDSLGWAHGSGAFKQTQRPARSLKLGLLALLLLTSIQPIPVEGKGAGGARGGGGGGGSARASGTAAVGSSAAVGGRYAGSYGSATGVRVAVATVVVLSAAGSYNHMRLRYANSSCGLFEVRAGALSKRVPLVVAPRTLAFHACSAMLCTLTEPRARQSSSSVLHLEERLAACLPSLSRTSARSTTPPHPPSQT